MKYLASLILCLFTPYLSKGQIYVQGGGVTDIDGNFYESVIYGYGQEWTTRNLRTTRYTNGDTISFGGSAQSWQSYYQEGAYSYYIPSEPYYSAFGNWYNFYTVEDPRHLCPGGWHVPTDEEWGTLIEYVLQYDSTPAAWASAGSQFWYQLQNATNLSGFSAEPAGARQFSGQINGTHGAAGWWSGEAPEGIVGSANAWYMEDDFLIGSILRNSRWGYSIRCVSNSIPTGTIDSASEEDEALIFPNPTQGVFFCNSEGSIELFDLLGKKVFHKPVKAREAVDISDLPAGAYSVRVWESASNQPVYSKLVKR